LSTRLALGAQGYHRGREPQARMSRPRTRDQLAAELEELRRQFEQFIHFLPDALVEVDLETACLRSANRMAHILFGYPEGAMPGLPGRELFAPGEYERAEVLVRDRLAKGSDPGQPYRRSGRNELFEFTMRRHDGNLFPAEAQSSFVLDESGRPLRMRSIVRDVSERKVLEAQLEALSMRDPLTGCYNRRYLARLRSDLERPTARWACIAMDLEGLKTINDTYGHQEGDRVLHGFAHFLGLHHRSDDVLLRLGGDEFALILPGTEDGDAQALCQRLLEAARDGSPAQFSLGVAARRPGETLEEVMARADSEMYAARGRPVTPPSPGESA
jgi:diguanylate cyclase (GGDEF)-like protein/PAS domain S-box-containing protein